MKHESDSHLQQTSAGLNGLDPLLQHRSRLGALVLLSRRDALSFARLRELLEETDGNLGAQLGKLEKAKYLTVRKEFQERKPISWYALTPRGQSALKAHLHALEYLIKASDV